MDRQPNPIDRGDEPLIDAARRGDERAMAELFAMVNPGLMRLLRATEPSHADDLAGDTWIGIATNLHRFSGDLGSFRAWAFTIARRRIGDHRRRAGRRPTDIVDPHSLNEVPDTESTAELATQRVSQAEAIRLITEHLSAEHAEVVLLRVLAELSPDEIADVVGRSPGWVRVTTHRALRKLADRIGPKLDVTQ